MSTADIEAVHVDPEVLKLLPEAFMRRMCVVPLRRDGAFLHIAVKDTRDFQIIDSARLLSGFDIKAYQTTEKQIWDVLGTYFSLSSVHQDKSAGVDSDSDEFLQRFSVSKWMDGMLERAIASRASDVHVEPQDNTLFIRFRIDGVLNTVEKLSKKVQPQIISRIKVLAGMDIADKRTPQDGQFSCKVLSRKIDFRVSTLPAKYGEKVVIRVLDKTSFALSLDQLGFRPADQARFEDLIHKPNGIILVTGPTGSGKTTTLYGVLNRLASPARNVITLEDPIEYELLAGSTRESGITQVQVNPKCGLDFANGLRAILRQDPNVIMLGEIRDRETSEIAMRSALTGHLVLSTLHTNDAPGTIMRLFDMGVEPFLVASSVVGILAQRLVRLLCPYCKESYRLPERALESWRKTTGKDEPPTLFRARGCSRCGQTGYLGRRGVFELMVVDDNMRNLILEKAKHADIREAAIGGGMSTLRDCGWDMVMEGLTTMEEIYHLMI